MLRRMITPVVTPLHSTTPEHWLSTFHDDGTLNSPSILSTVHWAAGLDTVCQFKAEDGSNVAHG